MKRGKSYILVALILFALGLAILAFMSTWAKKPPDPPDSPETLGPSPSIAVTVIVVPNVFSLSQNYPNPFNSSTIIKYTLPEAVWVKLEVYNILGKKVATLVDSKQQPGYYSYVYGVTGRASGVYFCRITAGRFQKSRKMLLVR